MLKRKKGGGLLFSPHYDRPKRYFLKNGLIRRMFDVTMQKPMTNMPMTMESVVSITKL